MINAFEFLPSALQEAHNAHKAFSLSSYVTELCEENILVEAALMVLLEQSENGEDSMLSIAEKVRKGVIKTINGKVDDE